MLANSPLIATLQQQVKEVQGQQSQLSKDLTEVKSGQSKGFANLEKLILAQSRATGSRVAAEPDPKTENAEGGPEPDLDDGPASIVIDKNRHEKLVAYLSLKPDAPGVKNACPTIDEPEILFEDWWSRVQHSRRLATWQGTLENMGFSSRDLDGIT
eukprot:7004968-Karenia_brevis.AAC.1